MRDARGRAAGLQIRRKEQRLDWALMAHGAYLLRTNCPQSDPCAFWQWYIQLQQAEAAFRTGKSDLWLRPVFHQKTKRVEAHILVCFLTLALWRTLEMWMRGKGLGTCTRSLRPKDFRCSALGDGRSEVGIFQSSCIQSPNGPVPIPVKS
jgi:hypothetical protein